MKVVQLPIKDQNGNMSTNIGSVFDHGGRVYGDTLSYVCVSRPTNEPFFNSVQLPNEGDNSRPPTNIPGGWEFINPVFAGYTSTGRPVLLYRCGNHPNGEWDGSQGLFAAIGAATANRELGQATTINVSQPGMPGAKGDKGDRGNDGARGQTGPQGPQGAPGKDGDIEAAQKLGNYPYQQGVTVRGQNDSIEAQVKGSRVDAAYIAEQNREIVAKLDALVTSIATLTAAIKTTTPVR